MTRKEFNEKFIAELNNLDAHRLTVATKVRKYDFDSAKNIEDIKNILMTKFNDDASSWCVNEVAYEYDRIKCLTDENLQIWINYREFGNADEPIAKANGDFLAVSFKGVNVTIDSQDFTITNSEYITVPANHYSGDGGEYATISFAAIDKLLKIRGHLAEIARLVN